MLDRWQREKKRIVNMEQDIAALTLKISSRLLDKTGVLTPEQHKHIVSTFSAAIAYVPVTSLLKQAAPLMAPVPAFKYFTGKPKVQQYTLDLVSTRNKQPHVPDMLGWMLKSLEEGEFTSLREVADQVITLYFAMYDTMKWIISYTLWQVAQHQAVQAKVTAEDRTPRQTPLQAADVADRAYLQATVNEALRMGPAVWNIPLQTYQVVSLPSGHALQPGYGVFLSLAHVHQSNSHWQNPEQFMPERMLEPRSLRNEAYMPFGDGTGGRMCLGPNIEALEAPLVVGNILHRVEVDTVPAREPKIASGAGFTFKKLELGITWR
jgi:cytochrome P450